MFKNPENLNLIEDSHHNLFCEKTKSFIEDIKNIKPADGSDIKASFADFSQKDEYKDFLNTIALRAEVIFRKTDQMKFYFAFRVKRYKYKRKTF